MMNETPRNFSDRNRENDFVRNVLSRTSGSGCDSACRQLPGLADGQLGDVDRQLVQAHLEHCDGCRSVAVVLGWVQPMLTDLSELDPGPDFLRSVVARTTGAELPYSLAARRGETVGPLGLIERLGQWWQKQLFRPRFALEFAYVATVILVLLTSIPGAPLKQEARSAQEMIQAGPMAVPLLGSVINNSQRQLDDISAKTRSRASGQWDRVTEDWSNRRDRSDEARRAVLNHLELAWNFGRTGQLNPAGYQMLLAGKNTAQAWNQLWHDQNKTNRDNPNQ